MNARALVLAAILYAPATAVQADGPAPTPGEPGTPGTDGALSPEDEAYCEHRCRTRAGCFDDDRCRVYRERAADPGAEH